MPGQVDSQFFWSRSKSNADECGDTGKIIAVAGAHAHGRELALPGRSIETSPFGLRMRVTLAGPAAVVQSLVLLECRRRTAGRTGRRRPHPSPTARLALRRPASSRQPLASSAARMRARLRVGFAAGASLHALALQRGEIALHAVDWAFQRPAPLRGQEAEDRSRRCGPASCRRQLLALRFTARSYFLNWLELPPFPADASSASSWRQMRERGQRRVGRRQRQAALRRLPPRPATPFRRIASSALRPSLSPCRIAAASLARRS